MEQLNIVELIENNPITKLSSDYNVKLLVKIKEHFSDFEQQLFLSSFYCYLNHHPTNDFIIDLDDMWKWLGFGQKIKAKILLEKQFTLNKDYIKSLSLPGKGPNSHVKGGQNKEIFMLNVKTFKSFCLKAGTKKADEIHEYYMKMEELIQEVINEESNELKIQLETKNLQIKNITIQLNTQSQQLENVEKDKDLLKEQTIIDQFPVNTQCIYIGRIDNKTLGKPGHKMYHETVIKFGQSNNLSERVKCHKKTYDNFILYAAYKVKNKIEIENAIKKHPELQRQIRLITLTDGITHRELLALDEDKFTIDVIEKYIKEIIKENEYNIENYNLLLKKNAVQEEENNHLKEQLDTANKKITELTSKLQNYTGEGNIDVETKNKIASNYAICKYGYFLYAFQYEEMRFICSISRQKDFESVNNNLKMLYPQGEMICKYIVNYPFSEKNMMFLLKQHCACLGSNKFETSVENINTIIDISVNLETLLINNSKDLPTLLSIVKNEKVVNSAAEMCNPEAPQVKKGKRSIDQIDKTTGEIINTFESIEAAGRFLGLTTGTAVGISLREKTCCRGYLFRYSGFSKEEQFLEQKVIKVCCTTGEKTPFPTIADAARNSNISAPALRQRILTDVHINGHHWIFDKS
jgi:hypothetical protein